jgi:hypothetical protein
MPMSRLPRKTLTGFVAHPRPVGCPDMTWGRSLKKALKSNDLPTDFGSWTAIAKDRMKWRAAVHAKDTHTHIQFVMKPPPLLITSKQQPPPAPPRCISVTIYLCTTRPDQTSVWRSTGHATCSVPRSALCISGSIIKSTQVTITKRPRSLKTDKEGVYFSYHQLKIAPRRRTIVARGRHSPSAIYTLCEQKSSR